MCFCKNHKSTFVIGYFLSSAEYNGYMARPINIVPAEFDDLFINDAPLIDVRAPNEFLKGSFPAAINLPILNDEQRRQVGTCYRKSGSEAATALGYQLLGGGKQLELIKLWKNHLLNHASAAVFCFRGGDRSRIACEWLEANSSPTPRILGGFKALRKHLLNVFENLQPLVIVSGRTGSGKTEFLRKFQNSVDLEGIANHRGSAFGGRISPQPCQIDFENRTAIAFLKIRSGPETLLEDESRLIGRISLPLPLQQKMKQSPIVIIEEKLESRADRIFQEYIVQQWNDYKEHFQSRANLQFEQYLLAALDAIRKRLGGAAYQKIRGQMLEACNYQNHSDSLELHQAWITALLSDYYDPMYDYQMSKKSAHVWARDSRKGLEEWYRDKKESCDE